jgi:hypothetical protein
MPMLPTTQARRTHDYVRHGTTSLFAAYNLASGSVIAQHYCRHRYQEFLRFLKLIDTAVPKTLDLILILDSYATHKAPRSNSGWSSTSASTCTSPPPARPGSTWSSAGSPS